MPTSKASVYLPWYHDNSTQMNRRVRTRTHGGVAGKAREGLPMPIIAFARVVVAPTFET
jgi:hypothetical protein